MGNETMCDQKTVLVVDDDVDFLEQHKLLLESDGYNVVTADGLAEAEKALETCKPDLAVLDLMMEHMDAGFTLCHRIKKIDESIPVIMVTSVISETGHDFHGSTSLERSWIKADKVLDKPVRFEQLKREIDRLVKDA